MLVSLRVVGATATGRVLANSFTCEPRRHGLAGDFENPGELSLAGSGQRMAVTSPVVQAQRDRGVGGAGRSRCGVTSAVSLLGQIAGSQGGPVWFLDATLAGSVSGWL